MTIAVDLGCKATKKIEKKEEYFLIHQLKNVLGVQKNHLIDMVLLSTNNICFG